MTLAGIEAGGTKWICAVGHAPDEIDEIVTLPTTTPDDTIARTAAFFAPYGPLAAVGVGSFGPLDLRPHSPRWGHITTTPKPGWSGTDVAGRLTRALAAPIALDTDVNAAALGEHRYGAARGLSTFCYITVGTGIGGGAYANGGLMHGLVHPEFGHMRVPHDRARDPFDGVCPFHGDCLEGLASGEAIRARWGFAGEGVLHEAGCELEAEYLALGLVNVSMVLSPERIVIGGGVLGQPGLLERIRAHARELFAGYLAAPELGERIDEYIVAPGLGDRAGIVGSLALAERLVTAEPGLAATS
jgi:fructokinase